MLGTLLIALHGTQCQRSYWPGDHGRQHGHGLARPTANGGTDRVQSAVGLVEIFDALLRSLRIRHGRAIGRHTGDHLIHHRTARAREAGQLIDASRRVITKRAQTLQRTRRHLARARHERPRRRADRALSFCRDLLALLIQKRLSAVLFIGISQVLLHIGIPLVQHPQFITS